MVSRNTRALGDRAEDLALQFLAARGLAAVARNFRCRLGEIDLIMRDDGCLVFVEVRYRGGRSFTRAGLTVDRMKQRKLIRTAALYIAKREQFAHCPLRFDVVAIDADAENNETIEWLRDAFRPPDASL